MSGVMKYTQRKRQRAARFEKALQEIYSANGENAKVCNATILKQKLKTLPKRWRNWTLRAVFSVILIGYFCFTIYSGPIAIMLSTLLIQVQCFSEIVNIANNVNKMPGFPWFRSLSWYFLISVNYFNYGETLTDYFQAFIEKDDCLNYMFKYHRFVSFCLYFIGVIWFVLSLVRKHSLQQYSLLAWTHFALLIIVIQSYMIVKNIFQGLIWLVVPVSMVVCNDIMAYLFGTFFGRTPLIKLSPKKTWEGFIGGGVATVIYGCIISYILCQYKYFICPIEYVNHSGTIKMMTECEPYDMFQLKNYTFNVNFPGFIQFDGFFTIYPFIFHSLALSIFSSVIGPFGGFFASGLKRAYKIKDFGGIIPGHGGIMDRFDCQYLMATFVNVYITSFIKIASPEKIFSKVSYLPPYRQLEFFYLLQDSLNDRNILERTFNATRI